ncbi:MULTISPECIES: hypothetical protein [Streptomyces]|uniref:hypothetical protein n=1 Tax=Streptomyces TaxID=1883 RepID=UPI002E270F6C|nr:hypothetical protein OH837_12040 [Streptomyces canus]WSZ34595.1 hypothetical protein OG806_36725 [Streptomyces sp. NBC_00882]WSZ61447.1 hypothetical protein OH824_35275 [Streptomyces canus]
MATFGRRLLLAVDAKGYGGARVVTQSQFQEAIQKLIARAADAAGLDRDNWQTQEGGDSLFAVLPEGASEPDLVDPFMRKLDAGLRDFNQDRLPDRWLRLRAAVHFGTASRADNGFVGRAPVEIGRILDSVPLRSALAVAPEACLAVAVSATVFNDVIGEAYTTIRSEEFREVRIEKKEFCGTAWLWVPGHNARALGIDTESGDSGADEPGAHGGAGGGAGAATRPRSAPTAPGDTVVHHFHGTVNAAGAVFGISK